MYVESAILFGNSIMKRDSHDTTVDLCTAINNRMAEKEIRSHLNIIVAIAWKRYGVKLQSIMFTEADFARKAKRRQTPVAAIIEEGRVIAGKTMRELLR
jgi:threonine aldolase